MSNDPSAARLASIGGASGVARRGLLLVLSAPSGAGKTTLAERLLMSDAEIALSVSVTTRPKRAGETDGRDYHFVSTERFGQMRDDDQLLEWATVFDNFYGTPRGPVEERMQAGADLLFDIDWQGAEQLNQKLPRDLVRVFILPPSAAALRDRLEKRGKDSAEVIAGRMARAADEISHWAQYDYVIVNDDLDHSFAGLQAILAAERLKRARATGLPSFVRDLQAGL